MKNSPGVSAAGFAPAADVIDDASLDLTARAFAGCDLSRDELSSLLAGSEDHHVLAGTVIAKEGDDGACFVVRTGLLSLTCVRNGVERIVGTAAAGDVVGGDTLLGETIVPFGSSVVAASDADLVALDASAVRRTIDDNPAFARLVRDRSERALLEQLVRATTSFDGVSSADLRTLLQSVERRRVAAGEAIVMQGDDADEAFVVVEGAVDVIDESTHRVLATLRTGALFGETALINEDHRNATVRAHDDTCCGVNRS
jgi:CRP-like cAMP-binding protein